MTQQSDEQLLEHAEQMLREGRHGQASALLEDYLHRHRDSARAWWALSYAASDPQEQIECVEKVLELKPSHSAALARLEKLQKVRPVQPFKTVPVAPRPRKQSAMVQYIVLGVMGCFALALVGLGGVMFLNRGMASPLAPAATRSSEISLPPTWTPTISPTPAPTMTFVPAFSTITINTPNDLPALQTAVAGSKVGTSPGYYAPDFSLVDVSNNSKVRLSDYKGNGVIIYFWATWCPYCNDETDDIQAIYKNYRDDGVMVLGLDVGENADLARKYKDYKGLTFPILDDSTSQVAAQYGLRGFPTHVFVDPSGVITYIASGALDYNNLEQLVSEMMRIQ